MNDKDRTVTDTDITNMILRAEALMKSNWLHGVHLLRQATLAKPDSPRAWAALGEFYHSRRMFDQAVESFQTALNLDPENDYLKIMTGNCHFGAGNHRLAVVYYDMVSTPTPDVTHNKALALAYMGKTMESIAIIKDMLTKIRNYPFMYFLLVEQLLRLENYTEAMHYIRECESLYGAHQHLMLLKAITYSRQEIWLTAYHAFSKYEERSPLVDYEHLQAYAVCALRIGLPNRAINLYERALLDNPYSGLLYEELLRLLIQKKDYDKARAVMKQAKAKLERMNPIIKLLEARLRSDKSPDAE